MKFPRFREMSHGYTGCGSCGIRWRSNTGYKYSIIYSASLSRFSFRLRTSRKSRWLTTIPDAPTLSSEPKKLYKPERSTAPDSHAAFFRLRFLYACEKSRYVGSGRIQHPKGEYVRPVSGGFLSSRHPNECPKKAARGKWKCLDVQPS